MTIDFTYSSSLNKVTAQKARASYKISINDRPILSLAIDKRQKGGQGLGKNHRITELYIDPDNRVFAGFIAKDRGGKFYEYAIIGRLHVMKEEAV